MPENWYIQRISSQQDGVTSLECLEGQHAAVFTLRNPTTGEVATLSMCIANVATGACDVLEALGTAGYTIIGTSAECP